MGAVKMVANEVASRTATTLAPVQRSDMMEVRVEHLDLRDLVDR